MKGDRQESRTHICGYGGSVLDYIVILENGEVCLIKEMQVVTRIESNYLPVSFNLEIDGRKKAKDTERSNEKEEKKD